MNRRLTILNHLSTLALIFIPFVAFGQTKYGETEEEQLLCKEGLSVYKSYKKQNNYVDAYVMWQRACAVCPETVSETLYTDGVKFVKETMKVAKVDGDTLRESILVDSLFMLYDRRMELYPSTAKKPNNRCSILGYKAMDQYKHFKSEPHRANAMFQEAIECLQGSSRAAFLSSYYVTSFYMMKKLEGAAADEKLASMLTDYLALMEYSDEGIANAETAGDEKKKAGFLKAKGNIDEIFVAIAKCDDMVPVLIAKVEANPEDIDLKIKVLRLLNKKNCSDNALYLPIAIAVHDATPVASSAFAIGKSQAKKQNFSESLTYLEQAVELCGECSEQEPYLLEAGKTASFLQREATALGYARKVLKLNPESGAAYMLIGDAIAGSAKSCDDGALGMRSAYWVASDYYSRAKRLGDEDVASKAAKKLADAKKQFPTIDDIFTVGKQNGSSFTVPAIGGCLCSGEKTTIRVR